MESRPFQRSTRSGSQIKEIWVLGCGPSLAEVPIPEVLTIGTNDSFQRHWSPIYVTADNKCLHQKAKAISYYSCLGEAPAPFQNVHIRGPARNFSGVLAYYLAQAWFRAEAVRLVGFDMDWRQGHFNQDEVRPVSYERAKRALRQWFSVPTLIWRDAWLPLESIFNGVT